MQMASLLSMSTLSSDYQLWRSYANAKRRLGVPATAPSARQRWRAAQVAVHDALHGRKVRCALSRHLPASRAFRLYLL